MMLWCVRAQAGEAEERKVEAEEAERAAYEEVQATMNSLISKVVVAMTPVGEQPAIVVEVRMETEAQFVVRDVLATLVENVVKKEEEEDADRME